ncbi:MAG: tetratricopeptide repeat protein [Chloroflexi bacterium]|nr:tetratricopeptide repeat protein [Chloroflexota bacterium]
MLQQRVFRRLFTEMVRGPDEDVDLALAALYIAGEERPELDVDACMAAIDVLAKRTAEALPQGASPQERLAALGRHLAQAEGFHGVTETPVEPRNDYLDQVLEGKRGTGIALCILYKAVAARCGLVLEGIGLPGHFILRHAVPGEVLYLDPLGRGRLMTHTECEESVRSRYQGRVPFREEFLFPYDKKQMLVRLLTSLKVAYFETREYSKALAAADRIAIIDPNLSVNIRERARLYYLLGRYREAIRSLELYLKLFPEADDKEKAEGEIQALWSLIATLG